MYVGLHVFVSFCVVLCVSVWVRGQAQIEKVVSLDLCCLQQLEGAAQLKNEKAVGGDVDEGLEGGNGGGDVSLKHMDVCHSKSSPPPFLLCCFSRPI